MHELIAIFLITGGSCFGPDGSIGAVEQYLTIDALGNPAVLQLLALVLQFEEELLVREIQVVARRLVAKPAGHLQQPSEDVDFLLVGEDLNPRDSTAVVCRSALQLALFYIVIGSHLFDELIHAGRVLIGHRFFRRIMCSVVQVGDPLQPPRGEAFCDPLPREGLGEGFCWNLFRLSFMLWN